MTDAWRGLPEEEQPIDRWFRHRYLERTVFVLNIDKLICDPGLNHGVLFELKHVDAREKHWRATRHIATRMGWWAGLIEHDNLEPRFVTLLPPGSRMIPRHPFDAAKFDAWVCANFGARMLEAV